MRRYKLPWWKTADACAPGIAIGNFFGRQGCFAAGCCWGKPTTLPWGVKFTELGHEITGVPIDVHLHPTQLYESFAMLIVFLLPALAAQAQTLQRAGDSLLRAALFSHSLLHRVCARRSARRSSGTDNADRLSTSQIISLIVGTGALILLIVRWRKASLRKRTPTANASATA